MRILLDQNAPRRLRDHLPGHDVFSARQMGWSALENGELIAAAQATGFHVIITADQNIRYQQNLSGRRIALVVLNTNHWNVIREKIDRVRDAVGGAVEGSYILLAFDRPPRVRRPYPSSEP
jgi:predicted nuclease of predicted toxin-antitoxin system